MMEGSEMKIFLHYETDFSSWHLAFFPSKRVHLCKQILDVRVVLAVCVDDGNNSGNQSLRMDSLVNVYYLNHFITMKIGNKDL